MENSQKPIMLDNQIINLAITELKDTEKFYKMFTDFTFMRGIEWGNPEFQKIRYFLIRCEAFEKHTDHALRLSKLGLQIVASNKTWEQYLNSLKPKTDYFKWAGIIISVLSLIWNIYQGITNNNLKEKNIKLELENSLLKSLPK